MTPRLTVVALVLFAAAALAGPILVLASADRGSAAFGDNETIGVNRLSSATVEIEPGQDVVPITANNLAPGDRVTGSISVGNVGSLPVRYAIVSEGPSNALTPWLRWEIWLRPDTDECDTEPPAEGLLMQGPLVGGPPAAVFGDVTIGLDPGDRILSPGEQETMCTAVTLSLEAPDGAQSQKLRQEFIVVAEQHTDELDRATP